MRLTITWPYQFPEKLIPLMIANALEDRALPVYGDGMQVRDWLYVEDHCRGILAVLHKGRAGEIYNIGGNRSLPNLDVVHKVLSLTGKPESLIRYVTDRPGHDRRYALSSEKLMRETDWRPLTVQFEDGLARTIDWYRKNADWVARVLERRIPHVLREELREPGRRVAVRFRGQGTRHAGSCRSDGR